MITLISSILILVLAYFVYGKLIEKKFGADAKKETPAIRLKDGVDYLVLPGWKIFMIQLLNIAGLGPIFGAILGAMYGPVAYIWIVFGCIFMGAVHDYFSGMLSIRNDGKSLTEVTGKYMGNFFKQFSLIITFVCLILVGAAFVNGPAALLTQFTGNIIGLQLWIIIIFSYYFIATLFPINKIIGKIYPFFGLALLVMAVGIGGYLLFGDIELLEISTTNIKNFHINPQENIMIPMLFVVISCGALSGFHSTQSPMMARCLKNEKHGRFAFYGAMITEGIIAMIWATAAINYFGGPEELNTIMTEVGHNPAWLVNEICNSWLGKTGAVLALIGVIVLPITTGDTAYRSARLLIADTFNIKQKSIWKRIFVATPIFLTGIILSNLDFSVIWKYFGVINQAVAAITLWTATMYMVYHKKNHLFVSIPAVIITFVVVSYFLVAPVKNGGLFLQVELGYTIGVLISLFAFAYVIIKQRKINQSN
jgi:carbon starvation protein CstA